jgi:hypothetical protein
LSAETGFEALNTDYGKEEPEETDKKGYPNKQGRSFLEASKDDLDGWISRLK